MVATIDYYPTGKLILLKNHIYRDYFVTDERFVLYNFEGNNLLVGTTTLENKEGEITLSEDDWFSVPIVDQDMLPIYALDGDI